MGYLSRANLAPNKLEQTRLSLVEKGREIFDLTDSNLTNLNSRVSPHHLLRLFGEYLEQRRYHPEPRGLLAARQAVANYYITRGLKDISAEGIFFTASTSEAYRLLFSLLAEPGDSILAPVLGYPLIEQIAEECRLDCRHYKLFSAEKDWCYEPPKDNESSQLLCLISPHNPSGAVLREVSGWMCAQPIIADEVFCEYCWSGSAPPIGALVEDHPVFHLHGLSKLLALPDLKLAWIALNNRALDEYGERLEYLNDLYLSANQFLQYALPGLLNDRAQVIQPLREEISKRIELVTKTLSGLPAIDISPPQAGTALFPRISTTTDTEEFCLQLLENTGVLVHPGYFYGENFSDHIFISALPPEHSLQQGLERLRDYLA